MKSRLRWYGLWLVGASLSFCTVLAQAAPVLDYKLTLSEDGSAYQVWMMPTETPKPDLSLTGQLTIKVPHKAGFKISEVKPAIKDVMWTEASRVDAPQEAKDSDYISFSFFGVQNGSSVKKYNWEAGKEQLIFSFSNEAGCVNDVSIIEANDPFNKTDNSAHTNPGNHFSNLGWGVANENHFRKVYGNTPKCPKK